jgi:glycosyltransferase involved in cell wall biosynthesis
MTDNKRLVILLANYFEQCPGGAELQAYYLAKMASEKGWEVFYIFISNGQPYKNSLNINLLPIKKNFIASKLGNSKYLYIFHVLKLLYKTHPDAIYQRAASALTGIATLYSQINSNEMTYHIASDNEFIKTNWSRLLTIPENILQIYGQKHAKNIIAQTHFQAKAYASLYSRKVTTVISNGHPMPDDLPDKSANTTIVWIANMKPIKQPDIFIALAAALKEHHDVTCIMIGRIDNYSKIVQKAISDGHIIAPGETPNDEINKILEKAHILVNTSTHEGFSNTFIQAWMRGTTVVSLNVNPDNVLDTQGIGFCSGSYDQLVVDVNKLISNKNSIRNDMANKARNYSIRNFSLDNISKILTQIGT